MQELIKFNEENQSFPVSAKNLYSALHEDPKQKHYSQWARAMISDNKFSIEGIDYQQILNLGEIEKKKRGRPLTMDYSLTIIYSKKLSMLTKSKRGEEVRNYFLACEKKALNDVRPTLPANDTNLPVLSQMLPEALRLLADNIEKVKMLQPKADGYNQFLNIPEKAISFKEAAKLLNVYRKDKPKILLGQNSLFKLLREWGIIQKNNLPYQNYSSFFMVKEVVKTAIIQDKAELLSIPMTLLLPKGLERIRLRMVKENYVFAEDNQNNQLTIKE